VLSAFGLDASGRKYHRERSIGPAPDGRRLYDSKREALHAQELDLRKRAGDIRDWQAQVHIRLEIDGRPVRPFLGKRDAVYIADFLVELNDGRHEIHEVKGYVNSKDPVTRLWMLKLGIVRAMWPDVELVIVR
jgi:Protein of unknown function (DUF1064)